MNLILCYSSYRVPTLSLKFPSFPEILARAPPISSMAPLIPPRDTSQHTPMCRVQTRYHDQNIGNQDSPHLLSNLLAVTFLEIVPDLKNWKVPLLQQTRKDEVIMCRSRLGHARLTHAYLFRNEDPPECIYCACRLTVKDILIECPDFELSRQKYFNCNSLPELFV